MEVVREDERLLSHFGQTTFTVTHPGSIKAFHWHKKQDDVWFVASGHALVVLYDQREDSPTFRQTETITAGTDDYKVIVIPAGVVHGFKVLGDEPVYLFYHTTVSYQAKAPDEERIPYDDPTIGFDWSKYA
ncbi:MAG: dTDP-4-dehydrorhamnose 3,5-epimerase family protein [Patescibacteria group bacterium]|nr:dTDP-4-dehydrorhamnose 3,5-epimerase family protein [Patescibacteria group bacterium]